jgi:hypothetical protein
MLGDFHQKQRRESISLGNKCTAAAYFSSPHFLLRDLMPRPFAKAYLLCLGLFVLSCSLFFLSLSMFFTFAVQLLKKIGLFAKLVLTKK